jgi:hypothetical protein
MHTYSRCDAMLYDARDCPSGDAHTTWIDQSADLRLGGVNWQNRVFEVNRARSSSAEFEHMHLRPP